MAEPAARDEVRVPGQRTGERPDDGEALPDLADATWLHHGAVVAQTSFCSVARRLPAIVHEAAALAWRANRRDTAARGRRRPAGRRLRHDPAGRRPALPGHRGARRGRCLAVGPQG